MNSSQKAKKTSKKTTHRKQLVAYKEPKFKKSFRILQYYPLKQLIQSIYNVIDRNIIIKLFFDLQNQMDYIPLKFRKILGCRKLSLMCYQLCCLIFYQTNQLEIETRVSIIQKIISQNQILKNYKNSYNKMREQLENNLQKAQGIFESQNKQQPTTAIIQLKATKFIIKEDNQIRSTQLQTISQKNYFQASLYIYPRFTFYQQLQTVIDHKIQTTRNEKLQITNDQYLQKNNNQRFQSIKNQQLEIQKNQIETTNDQHSKSQNTKQPMKSAHSRQKNKKHPILLRKAPQSTQKQQQSQVITQGIMSEQQDFIPVVLNDKYLQRVKKLQQNINNIKNSKNKQDFF